MNDTPNDFESRSRAAGRAARHAMDDVPTVQMHRAARQRPRAVRSLVVAAAIVLVLAISGSFLAQRHDTPSAAQVSAFCEYLLRSQNSQQPIDERRGRELAPADLVADVETIARAGSDVSSASTETLKHLEASSERLSAWMQTNCYPNAALSGAAPADQRFAPDPLPSDAHLCFVANGPLGKYEQTPTSSHITIYGNTTLSDPWQGPLLATAVDETSLIDSEHEAPVAVANRPDALAGPIAGRDGAAIADSRGIEWDNTSRGATVAILARGEPLKSLLGSLAAQVVDTTGPPTIDPAALPKNYSVVYRGAVEPLTEGPSNLAGATFVVNARNDGSLRPPFGGIAWSGSDMSNDAIQATRFFANNPRLRTVDTTTALIWDGSPATHPGSTLARWRESDGVVITAEWASKNEAERRNGMDRMIGTMHRLDRTGWTALTEQFSYCGALSTLGQSGSRTGGGSGTPPESSPTATATTFPTPTSSVP